MRSALLLFATIALLTLVPTAARSESVRAPQPWATVNRCDTTAHPDQIGIRAGMPGIGRKAGLFMRFRVQYEDGGDWRTVAGADSGWTRLAKARRGEYDAGWTFGFDAPAAGGALVLRGIVSYQWRRGGRVVRGERKVTEAGHPGTAGADPADFSAATCAIA